MSLALIFVVFVFVFSLWYLISPFYAKEVEGSSDRMTDHTKENLLIKKEGVLETLEDLKLDRHLNKISEKDYQEMYQETITEGAKILKEMDQQPAQEEKVGEQKKDQIPDEKIIYCSQCGKKVETGAVFCSQCGNKLKADVT